VKAFRFDALGVFRFSPEAGTPAASMPDAVPEALAADRAERIMLAQQEIVIEANRRRIGSQVQVLVDGRDPSGRLVGRTPQQAPDIDSLCLLTGEAPPGEIVRGRVIDYDVYDLIVEPVGRAARAQ
jgi:ribosomal protein S12 methylthiotransferase